MFNWLQRASTVSCCAGIDFQHFLTQRLEVLEGQSGGHQIFGSAIALIEFMRDQAGNAELLELAMDAGR